MARSSLLRALPWSRPSCCPTKCAPSPSARMAPCRSPRPAMRSSRSSATSSWLTSSTRRVSKPSATTCSWRPVPAARRRSATLA
ncbi:UNVERIFIED_CONTAM: hypothetical protein NCL1_57241 [Trichonephila clavipes]